MSDEPQKIQPLTGQRHDRETDAAVVACNDYLRMGIGRSLRGLLESIQNTDKSLTKKLAWGTIAGWSHKFDWQERAAAYDAEQDEAKTTEIHRIRTEGLAADHNRIVELAEIFDALKQDFTASGLYRTDIKLSATGQQVEVESFNKPLIDTMRGILDDIAKEVGGRKQVVNLSITRDELKAMSDQEVEALARKRKLVTP